MSPCKVTVLATWSPVGAIQKLGSHLAQAASWNGAHQTLSREPSELRRVGRPPEIKWPLKTFLLILMHTPPSSCQVAQSQILGSRLPPGADTHFPSRRASWLKQPLNYLRGKCNPHYKFQPITCQSIQSRNKIQF